MEYEVTWFEFLASPTPSGGVRKMTALYKITPYGNLWKYELVPNSLRDLGSEGG